MSCEIAFVQKLFSEALCLCFKTQASIEIGVRVTNREEVHGDIAASIGFADQNCSGFVTLIFPAKTFLFITNQMLGEQATHISDENSDAASEFLNITYGLARKNLNLNGHAFSPAIPTVVSGKQIILNQSKTGSTFYLEANVQSYPFYISGTMIPQASRQDKAG